MARITRSLFILPPPPSPLGPASFPAAYNQAVTGCINVLRALPTSTELLVALPCPNLHFRLDLPKSHIYDEAQVLIAQMYNLGCLVCAKLGVEVESDAPGALDMRVVLVEYNPESPVAAADNSSTESPCCGPIISLLSLAGSRRRWSHIFSVDSEAGRKILADYTRVAGQISNPTSGPNMHVVPGGIEEVSDQAPYSHPPHPLSTAHHVVAVGGTFDHLHAGHKLLLTATALLLQPMDTASKDYRRLVIGITGDELLKNKKYTEYLKSWQQRQQDVVGFLISILSFADPAKAGITQTTTLDASQPQNRTVLTTLKQCSVVIECVEIQDPFGPTITDESVSALVVSGETRAGGKAVNDKRTEKGWQPLEIFEIDVLDAADPTETENAPNKVDEFASKISSSAIRKRRAEKAQISSL